MLEMDVSAGCLVNVKTALFKSADDLSGFEISELRRHPLDGDFDLFRERGLLNKRVFGNFLAVFA